MKDEQGIGIIGYLIIGILFQYIFYGEASLSLLSTWLHILAWPFILCFWFLWYAVLICVAVAIIAGIVALIG